MNHLLLYATLLVSSTIASAQTLNIYNWSDYQPQRVIDHFTRETGITVNYITYESNEEMYEKVKASGGEFDLIVPSTYFVSKLEKEGLLLPIDKSRLKNYKNLDQRLLNLPHDPRSEYSVP